MMASLTAGQLEMMRVLWEHGEQKPSEIQERFPRSIKNAALRFQLKLLLEKKHVRRRKVGKAYYYVAVTPREGAFRGMVGRLAETFCQGSTVGLIAELIRAERLTVAEIRELQRYARGKSRGGVSKKKGEAQ